MSSENFFWVKTTVENIVQEAITKARVIDVKNTWVSNYKKFKWDFCNWTPTWLCADYVAIWHTGNQSVTIKNLTNLNLPGRGNLEIFYLCCRDEHKVHC